MYYYHVCLCTITIPRELNQNYRRHLLLLPMKRPPWLLLVDIRVVVVPRPQFLFLGIDGVLIPFLSLVVVVFFFFLGIDNDLLLWFLSIDVLFFFLIYTTTVVIVVVRLFHALLRTTTTSFCHTAAATTTTTTTIRFEIVTGTTGTVESDAGIRAIAVFVGTWIGACAGSGTVRLLLRSSSVRGLRVRSGPVRLLVAAGAASADAGIVAGSVRVRRSVKFLLLRLVVVSFPFQVFRPVFVFLSAFFFSIYYWYY